MSEIFNNTGALCNDTGAASVIALVAASAPDGLVPMDTAISGTDRRIDYLRETSDRSVFEQGKGIYNSSSHEITVLEVTSNSLGTTASIDFQEDTNVYIVADKQTLESLSTHIRGKRGTLVLGQSNLVGTSATSSPIILPDLVKHYTRVNGDLAHYGTYIYGGVSGDAQPADDTFTVNNATPASITEMYFAENPTEHNQTLWGQFDDGDGIRIQLDSDATYSYLFAITTVVEVVVDAQNSYYRLTGTMDTVGIGGAFTVTTDVPRVLRAIGGVGGTLVGDYDPENGADVDSGYGLVTLDPSRITGFAANSGDSGRVVGHQGNDIGNIGIGFARRMAEVTNEEQLQVQFAAYNQPMSTFMPTGFLRDVMDAHKTKVFSELATYGKTQFDELIYVQGGGNAANGTDPIEFVKEFKLLRADLISNGWITEYTPIYMLEPTSDAFYPWPGTEAVGVFTNNLVKSVSTHDREVAIDNIHMLGDDLDDIGYVDLAPDTLGFRSIDNPSGHHVNWFGAPTDPLPTMDFASGYQAGTFRYSESSRKLFISEEDERGFGTWTYQEEGIAEDPGAGNFKVSDQDVVTGTIAAYFSNQCSDFASGNYTELPRNFNMDSRIDGMLLTKDGSDEWAIFTVDSKNYHAGVYAQYNLTFHSKSNTGATFPFALNDEVRVTQLFDGVDGYHVKGGAKWDEIVKYQSRTRHEGSESEAFRWATEEVWGSGYLWTLRNGKYGNFMFRIVSDGAIVTPYMWNNVFGLGVTNLNEAFNATGNIWTESSFHVEGTAYDGIKYGVMGVFPTYVKSSAFGYFTEPARMDWVAGSLSGDPTVEYATGFLPMRKFVIAPANTQSLWQVTIPRDYVPGNDIIVGVNWWSDGGDTSNPVRFNILGIIGAAHNQPSITTETFTHTTDNIPEEANFTSNRTEFTLPWSTHSAVLRAGAEIQGAITRQPWGGLDNSSDIYVGGVDIMGPSRGVTSTPKRLWTDVGGLYN